MAKRKTLGEVISERLAAHADQLEQATPCGGSVAARVACQLLQQKLSWSWAEADRLVKGCKPDELAALAACATAERPDGALLRVLDQIADARRPAKSKVDQAQPAEQEEKQTDADDHGQ